MGGEEAWTVSKDECGGRNDFWRADSINIWSMVIGSRRGDQLCEGFTQF